MSNETNSSNFIKNIVINDLETGKHDSIILVFHLNQMVTYISDMPKVYA